MNIGALLAGLLSGICGAMGLGGGTVLIIYLQFFEETEQLAAQGINIISFIPVAILAIFVYSKRGEIEWKIVIRIALWGILGVALGSFLTPFIKGKLLSKIFGGFLIVLGLKEFVLGLQKFLKKGKKCDTIK